MGRVAAVIGAAYGDEGKGHIVDWLASKQEGTIVVRHNGGAQAGHTVEISSGRHIFHHFGSGALAGAPTFLDIPFIVNPILFLKELNAPERLIGFMNKTVYVHSSCRVTTPYDMMINQAVEKKRGAKRHGSCGVGINETVTRNQIYPLHVNDLWDQKDLSIKLVQIRAQYVPHRIKQQNIISEADLPEGWNSDEIIRRFVEDCHSFLSHVAMVGSHRLLNDAAKVIFEGAQGLRLDEAYKDFPHVTRSRTGVPNVLATLQEMKVFELDLFYVTRAYLTRHGAGPLPNESPGIPFPNIKDETNIPHEFQGDLRFALLDIVSMSNDIGLDIQNVDPGMFTCHRNVAVTCLDQVPDQVKFLAAGREYVKHKSYFLKDVEFVTGSDAVVRSYGPNRSDVSWF